MFSDEPYLLARLRAGDEAAFVWLLERYHRPMLRVAQLYVPNREVAEEAVQDAWQGVLKGLHDFQGRSSLKTWIFRILINCARRRGQREARSLPFSALAQPDLEGDQPAVEPERFRATDPWPGHWVTFPTDWDSVPEERFLAEETRACVEQAIAALPPAQRAVITLRDIEQCSSEEVCSLLSLTEGNQRVLLHRARSKVRRALEAYLDGQ